MAKIDLQEFSFKGISRIAHGNELLGRLDGYFTAETVFGGSVFMMKILGIMILNLH